MPVLSGKYGEITIDSCNILEFESVNCEYGDETKEYNSRAGAGATLTSAGVASGSGQMAIWLDPDDPITGQFVSGGLYTLLIKETQGSNNLGTGSVRIGKLSLPDVNRNGELVRIQVPFTMHGVWTWTI